MALPREETRPCYSGGRVSACQVDIPVKIRHSESMTLPTVSTLDTFRNRAIVALANFVLGFASPAYRDFITNSIKLGIEKAIEDTRHEENGRI